MSNGTTILAIYGAVISTAALSWNIIRYYRGKRGKFRISATVGTQMLVSNQVSSQISYDVITIEVTNLSERTRFVRHIGYQIDRKENPFIVFLDFTKPIEYPIELEPGAQFSHSYKHDEIKGIDLNSLKGKRVRVMVKDTHGKFHYSKWYQATNLFLIR